MFYPELNGQTELRHTIRYIIDVKYLKFRRHIYCLKHQDQADNKRDVHCTTKEAV